MKKIALVIATIAAATACSQPNHRTPQPVYQAETPAVAQVSAIPGTIPSGEWLVPTEVAPGLYRSAGPSERFITYCQVTTEDADGHILEWKNSATVGENIMVRVTSKAVTVRNSDCAPFKKVG